MPIYEYSCKECGHQFEELVLGDDTGAAEKRDAPQAKDRMHDRIRYEESHDRHG